LTKDLLGKAVVEVVVLGKDGKAVFELLPLLPIFVFVVTKSPGVKIGGL
jgi:hypothetical protein